MEAFDTHIHSEGRSVEDLERMANEGIKYAITCAFYPIVPRHPETLLDLFRKLTEYEPKRAESAGMKLYTAIGIHPRCIPPKHDVVLNSIEEFEFVAFGEIGLETCSQEEIEVFRKQIRIAKRMDKPCIIHTPRREKVKVTEKTVEILKEEGFPEDLAVIDHVTPESVEIVVKSGFKAGITVQIGKLKPEDAYEILSKYGYEGFVLNSDTGFDKADSVAVAKTVRYLKDRGVSEGDIRKVALENGFKTFRIGRS